MEWEDVFKIPATSPKQKIHRELVLQISKTNHSAKKKGAGGRAGGRWPGASKEKESTSE